MGTVAKPTPQTTAAAQAAGYLERFGIPGALIFMAVTAAYISGQWLDAHMDRDHKVHAVSGLIPAVNGAAITVPPQAAVTPARMGLFWKLNGEGWSTEPFTAPAEGDWTVTLTKPPPGGAWAKLYVEDADGTDLYGPWFRLP